MVGLMVGRIAGTLAIQLAYYAPLGCFVVVALYGWKGTGRHAMSRPARSGG